LRITGFTSTVVGQRSVVVLCAEYRFPLTPGGLQICRKSAAQSFLVG
jgi:hypothetical protein